MLCMVCSPSCNFLLLVLVIIYKSLFLLCFPQDCATPVHRYVFEMLNPVFLSCAQFVFRFAREALNQDYASVSKLYNLFGRYLYCCFAEYAIVMRETLRQAILSGTAN